LLEQDAEQDYLTSYVVEAGPMDQLLRHSITFRIAVGSQQGRKVLTLQTISACDSGETFTDRLGNGAGFSLHAGVASKAQERKKLERLCRYIARPAVCATPDADSEWHRTAFERQVIDKSTSYVGATGGKYKLG
jgi:hypothetical protein